MSENEDQEDNEFIQSTHACPIRCVCEYSDAYRKIDIELTKKLNFRIVRYNFILKTLLPMQ